MMSVATLPAIGRTRSSECFEDIGARQGTRTQAQPRIAPGYWYQKCPRFSAYKIQASQQEGIELLRREEQGDGTVLFVFGTEAEKSSAGKQEAAPLQADVAADESVSTASSTEADQHRAISSQSVPEQVTPVKAESTSDFADEEPETASVVNSEEGTLAEASHTASHSGSSPKFTEDTLVNMKVAELREICKDNNVRGYSTLKKKELIERITTELG